MNNCPDSSIETHLETLKNYVSGIVLSCFGWLPCFQRRHLVHPVNTNLGTDKYLELGLHRRIHVIHIAPNRKLPNSKQPFTLNENAGYNNAQQRCQSMVSSASDNSLEDYWFTRWSRPLRVSDDCNCSFRRHWRKSLRESKKKFNLSRQTESSVYYASTKDNRDVTILRSPVNKEPSENLKQDSSHIEIFAENFIEDILNEAISHLSMKYSSMQVFDNCNNCTDATLKPNDITVTDNCTNDRETSTSNLPSCSNTAKHIQDPHEYNRPAKTLSCDSDAKSSKIFAHRKDSDRNQSAGCVNPSFLVSETDPIATATDKVPPTKTCSHVRRATKPLLYFLHGAGSSADIWWGLLHYFVAAGFEVVAPDMLGHGFSASPDHTAAYTFQRLLKDAVDVFDRFVGEHGKCVVIGHAYGCSLAAAVARHRTQVTHLVLISGGGPTPLAPAHLPSTFPCFRACIKPFIVCGFKRDVLYAPCGKHMAACDALSAGVPPHVLRHVAQGQDWPEGDSTFHRRILVPTLLVHGMRDPHVTLVQQCEMERTIPRSFLEIIPKAGHLAMLETPGQLSHMVHCFIEWWSR